MTAPARTTSPILKDIFDEMAKRRMRLIDMGVAVEKHEARISEYKRGVVQPGVTVVEAMAHELGYRLALEPLRDGKE